MLDSVVASADIADVISVQKSERDEVVMSKENESIKAKILALVAKMRTEFDFAPVSISIENNIPLGAGMGGSAADMSGVIIGIDELFSLNMGRAKRIAYADSVGCDTAFMLEGGCGRIVGRSSVVDRFVCVEREVTVAVQGFCNTANVFALYDKAPIKADYDNIALIRMLENGQFDESAPNVLTPYSAQLNPKISEAMEILGEGARMSGSGSSVFCFGQNARKAEKLKSLGYQVFNCRIGNFCSEVIKN